MFVTLNYNILCTFSEDKLGRKKRKKVTRGEISKRFILELLLFPEMGYLIYLLSDFELSWHPPQQTFGRV